MTVLRSRALAVILVLVVVLAWLVLDHTPGANPVRDAFSRLVTPLQYVAWRVTSPLLDGVGWISRLGSLDRENQALRREVAELRSQVMQLREAQIENENLRRQLAFKSAVPNYQLLSAEVIGYDPSNYLQYIIIDRGGNDGIEPGMPVLTAEGLVGRISEVSLSSAKVMLITDPSSSVTALVQRSRATGVVEGLPGHELVLRFIPQDADVAPGDVVLTSGLGGAFPRRLVIGQIVSVSVSDVEMFQQARVVPAVRLRELEMVMVLLNHEVAEVPIEGG